MYDEHNEFRSFAVRIAAVTGCDPDDIRRVERLMEDELGMPLSAIHTDAFSDHARRLHKYLLALREMAKSPAVSAELLGWTRDEFDACVARYLGS